MVGWEVLVSARMGCEVLERDDDDDDDDDNDNDNNSSSNNNKKYIYTHTYINSKITSSKHSQS